MEFYGFESGLNLQFSTKGDSSRQDVGVIQLQPLLRGTKQIAICGVFVISCNINLCRILPINNAAGGIETWELVALLNEK